jgi:hypothetical protein
VGFEEKEEEGEKWGYQWRESPGEKNHLAQKLWSEQIG